MERENSWPKYVQVHTHNVIYIYVYYIFVFLFHFEILHMLWERQLPDVSRSCKLQLPLPGLGIFTLYTQLHSAKYPNVNLGCSGLDRNEGMDQTEGLNDAPGPLVCADTDVPQIPNADHSSITLSRNCPQLSVPVNVFSSLHIHPLLTH